MHWHIRPVMAAIFHACKSNDADRLETKEEPLPNIIHYQHGWRNESFTVDIYPRDTRTLFGEIGSADWFQHQPHRRWQYKPPGNDGRINWQTHDGN